MTESNQETDKTDQPRLMEKQHSDLIDGPGGGIDYAVSFETSHSWNLF